MNRSCGLGTCGGRTRPPEPRLTLIRATRPTPKPPSGLMRVLTRPESDSDQGIRLGSGSGSALVGIRLVGTPDRGRPGPLPPERIRVRPPRMGFDEGRRRSPPVPIRVNPDGNPSRLPPAPGTAVRAPGPQVLDNYFLKNHFDDYFDRSNHFRSRMPGGGGNPAFQFVSCSIRGTFLRVRACTSRGYGSFKCQNI